MNRCVWIAIITFLAISTANAADWDLKTDTWVYTDTLGRQSPVYIDCPSTRSGKLIGMFYFLWQGTHGTPGPYDITKLLAADPTNPAYGPEGVFHWWGEPEAGYFLASDPWVIRRNLSMLSDAGVDVLIFDVTNGWTYPDVYIPLCQIATEMRANGHSIPQIAFITKSNGPNVVQTLYNDFYSKNLYSDLWFRWQGKPMIFGYQNEKLSDGTYLSDTIKNFFTWRESWAWDAGQRKWQWIDTYPQDYGWDTNSTVPEQIPVGVASHPVNNIGRSFHNGNEPARDAYGLCATTDQGLCFDEQWKRALSVDPSFVWVTGWNEWVAQRFISTGNGPQFMGKTLNAGETYFVDCYNREYSRDIEPMKGCYTDNYYYQLISNVRKYKGVRAPETPSAAKTITIDGSFSDWSDVGPEFRDTIGDTVRRDYNGWGTLHYSNITGRNDIVKCKVARDANNIYFYAETKATLTLYTGTNWMLIFLDTDQNPYTGWYGYDYVVNYGGLNATTTTIKRNTGGWNWALVDKVPYKVSGKMLEISIPISDLGYGTNIDPAFDFHIADNILTSGNIIEFAVNGDSAPNRRAYYRYSSSVPGPVWEFTRPDDLEGWSPTHAVSNMTVQNGCLVGDVSSGDPYIISQRYPSIDANANRYIQIRMKCTDGSIAELFWGTADQPYQVGGREVPFTIIPDGQFHDYIVDMTANSQWTGWVNTLRLDPTIATNGHFEIDYIRLRRTPRDTTKPTGSLTIKSGSQYTKVSSVTLTLAAQDDLSGVTSMRISNDGTFDTETWENYSTTKSWILSSGDGLKRVYAQFMDADGNVSNIISNTITLDTTPPPAPDAPTDAGAYSPTDSVTFTWNPVVDATSPVDGYNCLIGTSPTTSDIFNGFVTTITKTITGIPPNIYYCRVKAKDASDNYSITSPASNGVMSVECPCINIPECKALKSNQSAGLSSKTITAIFSDYFYIQEPNKPSGIKVIPLSMPALPIGSIIDVAGTLSTSPTGERSLINALISAH